MAKQKIKMVHCRYPKCMKLHESTELPKDEAYWDGKRGYYHPDCYHIMQTVNQIRDTFIKEINPLLTGQQVGMLVSTINNIVFSKGIDVDQLKFTVEYFIKNKPGALKYPAGLHYIIQDKDAAAAWKKEQDKKIKEELKRGLRAQTSIIDDPIDFELPDGFFNDYSTNKRSKFSSILEV